MLTQNTYPDFFDEEQTTQNETKIEAKTNTYEELIKLQSNRIDIEKIKNNKGMVAFSISCISSFLLLISGVLIVNLQLWFIPFFLIIFCIFVSSTIFTYLFKSSRNIIWIHLAGITIPFLVTALFTSSLFTGSILISCILIAFLLFIAFLETENAIVLNRVFIFKNLIYQPKKLIILTSFLLITFGAFMGINSVGGPKFIENTIGNSQVYNTLFDPSMRTALFGRAIISEKVQKQVDGTAAIDKKPLTYLDFLSLKLEDSTKAKTIFYESFAEKTYCKEAQVQTDESCKAKLEEFAKLTLAVKSKEDYGIDVNNPKDIPLTAPMTKDNIKRIIQKTYANNLANFLNSSSSATNPLKIYSILGKSEGVSLFIATIIFALLLITFTLFNLLATLTSWLSYRYLKKHNYLSIDTVDDQVEVFNY
jgi:hypothetical protein